MATSFLPERKKGKINGVEIKEFQIKGNQVRNIIGEVKKYQNYVLNEEFDIVLNYAAQQWATDALLPILDKIKAKRIFVPCGFSTLYDEKYQQYFKKMPDYLREYDWLVFHSYVYRDINFTKKFRIKNFSIIPNGADENEFL